MGTEKERRIRLRTIEATIMKAFKEGKKVSKENMILMMMGQWGATRKLAIDYIDTIKGKLGFTEVKGELIEGEVPEEEMINWLKETNGKSEES